VPVRTVVPTTRVSRAPGVQTCPAAPDAWAQRVDASAREPRRRRAPGAVPGHGRPPRHGGPGVSGWGTGTVPPREARGAKTTGWSLGPARSAGAHGPPHHRTAPGTPRAPRRACATPAVALWGTCGTAWPSRHHAAVAPARVWRRCPAAASGAPGGVLAPCRQGTRGGRSPSPRRGPPECPPGAGRAGGADEDVESGRRSWEEADGPGSPSVTRCQARPNQGLQATGNSLRSCVAAAAPRA
jgi:hypothetical protein